MKEWIVSFVSSIAASAVFYLFQQGNSSLTGYILLLICLTPIFYVYRNYQKIYGRLRNVFFKKIGILNGHIKSYSGEYPCRRVWTEITPSMWEEELKKVFKKESRIKMRQILISEINNSYSLIINPFGDNFPEEDTVLFKSFHQICKYVEDGGILFVTGQAFFHHQNTASSDKSKHAIEKTQDGFQSLEHSLLTYKFGIATTGNIYSTEIVQKGETTQTVDHNMPRLPVAIFEEPRDSMIEIYQDESSKEKYGELIQEPLQIKRFRALLPKTTNYVPILCERNGQQSVPLAIVRYGKGALIHCGMYLEKQDSIEFKIVLDFLRSYMSTQSHRAQ